MNKDKVLEALGRIGELGITRDVFPEPIREYSKEDFEVVRQYIQEQLMSTITDVEVKHALRTIANIETGRTDFTLEKITAIDDYPQAFETIRKALATTSKSAKEMFEALGYKYEFIDLKLAPKGIHRYTNGVYTLNIKENYYIKNNGFSAVVSLTPKELMAVAQQLKELVDEATN